MREVMRPVGRERRSRLPPIVPSRGYGGLRLPANPPYAQELRTGELNECAKS